MRALIIEDENQIAQAVSAGLLEMSMPSDTCETGRLGVETALSRNYDIIILDIGLPDMDGLEVMRRLRSLGDETPIIILTARNTLTDRVDGLNVGADDYMTKPFYMEELVARVRATLRRRNMQAAEALTLGRLTVDGRSRKVLVDTTWVRLTAREFELLSLLMRAPRHVFTQDEIMEEIWESPMARANNLVPVYVNRLRAKIAAAGVPDAIETIRGVGYCMAAPE